MAHLHPRRSVRFASAFSIATALAAQCPLQLQPAGATIGTVYSLRTLASGDVLATGDFTTIGGVAANRVARWNGTSWSALGAGTDGPVLAAVELASGELVIGGRFAFAGGTAATNIARWNGSAWSPLGAGITAPAAVVRALAQLANGDIVAGGSFTPAGGLTTGSLQRWNGSGWGSLGAVGIQHPHSSFVTSLVTLSNGDLIVGGRFRTIGGVAADSVARWNGSWSAMGTGWGPGIPGDGGVDCLLELANGDVLAGGRYAFFTSSPWVQRWDGSSWLSAGLSGGGAASVLAMAQLPNGDVVAGGSALTLVRWNGATWSAIAGVGSFDNSVFAVDVGATGTVRAGGAFTSVGGAAAASLAAFAPTCPATVASNGAGCTGSAGLNALASTSLPWLGTSWSTRATGMPANAFVLRALGFAPAAVPLVAILPQGGPGCTLLVSPDFVDVHLAAAGVAAMSLTIPPNLALVGVVVHAQVTPLELDPLGSIVSYTASNALAATLGAL